MRYLRPIRLRLSYYKHIEAIIDRLFYQMCFEPILVAFKKNGFKYAIENARDYIAEALKTGRIIFVDNKFYGEFTAEISKEFMRLGGSFDSLDKSWHIPTIPPSLQASIADAKLKMERIQADILTNLSNVHVDRDVNRSRITQEYEKTIININRDILLTLKGITVVPELTPQMIHNIAKAWGENLELYIKDWADKNILKLRQEIATNTFHGRRAEGFVKNIMENYGVSQRKAKFLARQETSLLMSQIREERYKDAGITRYKWSGSMDERERPDHKLLEGTVQTWDNPPVVDRRSGRTASPGQDYNCRCIAIPISNR